MKPPDMDLLLFHTPNCIEAGCDEAGRGCLAGPVVAAAVILKQPIIGLNDSKLLTKKRRNELRIEIEKSALAYAVAIVSPEQIDEINILKASIKAMKIALDKLAITPQHILIDGNMFSTYKAIKHTTIIKGDTKFQSIAAASILAKTYRDEIMESLHLENSAYKWDKNKGYPTKEHREAIRLNGISIHHRKSFQLLPR
jgi:ribonuclease HII